MFETNQVLDILLSWQIKEAPELFRDDLEEELKEVGMEYSPSKVAEAMGILSEFDSFIQQYMK